MNWSDQNYKFVYIKMYYFFLIWGIIKITILINSKKKHKFQLFSNITLIVLFDLYSDD